MSTDRLKAVIRRLPPNLPEDVFWKSVSSWVSPDTVTWRSFHPGKLRKRLDKESVPSRAYIAFKSSEQVSQFGREYDGHLFRDKQGNESFAVVEFAPFQKVPPERKKVDTRAGTILQDEDYMSFIESLKDMSSPGTKNPEVADALPSTGGDQPKSTPLLEALKAEKAAAKDAAQILSYHGHYSSADRRHATSSSSKVAAVAAKEQANYDDPNVFSRTAPVPAAVDVAAPAVAGGSSSGGGKKPDAKSRANAGKPPTTGATSGPGGGGGPGKKRHNRSNSSASTPQPSQPVQQQNQQQQASRGQQGKAMASAPPAAEVDTQPAKERERKRPVLNNPRMFEAALAGVNGGAGKSPGAGQLTRKEKREAKKADVDAESAASVPATPVAASMAESVSQNAAAKDASSKETPKDNKDKKDKHPKAKHPNRSRGTNTAPAVRALSPSSPPMILSRDSTSVPSSGPNVGETQTSNPGAPENGPASATGSTRGQHANGAARRGRGRGRGGRGGGGGGAGGNVTGSGSGGGGGG